MSIERAIRLTRAEALKIIAQCRRMERTPHEPVNTDRTCWGNARTDHHGFIIERHEDAH